MALPIAHALIGGSLLRLLLLPQVTQLPSKAERYAALKTQLEAQRSALHTRWNDPASKRPELLLEARALVLERITNAYFPLWYGTPWDFNGTTRVPGQGKIACGYFVTTVLQDAGFRIPRVKWAQLAAEPMIRKVAPTARSFSNASAQAVVEQVHAQGDGLYAVGLDSHVGFLLKQGRTVSFVHSNYYRPDEGVIAEPAIGENPFAHSRYRVVGKLFDDAMMERWITGSEW